MFPQTASEKTAIQYSSLEITARRLYSTFSKMKQPRYLDKLIEVVMAVFDED